MTGWREESAEQKLHGFQCEQTCVLITWIVHGISCDYKITLANVIMDFIKKEMKLNEFLTLREEIFSHSGFL